MRGSGGREDGPAHPGEAPGLFAGADVPDTVTAGPAPTVPRAFVDLSETAIRHRDPERFALLYRALWRLTHGEAAGESEVR